MTASASPTARAPSTVRIVGLLLLVVAASLRLWNFPLSHQDRQDEGGYLYGSLALLEGLTPGYGAAPAGPQTYLGWTYAAGKSANYLARPGPEERAASGPLRPLVALNHAIFDCYRDINPMRTFIVWIHIAMALWAVHAAFRLGLHRAGLIGGLVTGGLAAFTPALVAYSDMARPYTLAWSLGILAICTAALKSGRIRCDASALLLGLAIGSRIDMLPLLPLVWWEFIHRPDPASRPLSRCVRLTVIAGVVALLSAPWMMTNLLGMLRAVVTIQFTPPPTGSTPARLTFRELTWFGLPSPDLDYPQALALAAVIIVAGLALAYRTRAGWLLLVYMLLLLASLFKSTGYGVHHKGAVLVALVTGSAAAIGGWRAYWLARWRAIGSALVICCVVPSLIQTVNAIRWDRRQTVADRSVAWVESHVPAGTRVYVGPSLRRLLPTPAAADLLWQEVSDSEAWRKKLARGLDRLNVSAADLPRAMSEQNLVQERGNRRAWFILGSRPLDPAPRYDVRTYRSSPVFGVQDLPAAFNKSGGVVVWQQDQFNRFPSSWGDPVTQWTAPDGTGTLIFVSPDVRSALRP